MIETVMSVTCKLGMLQDAANVGYRIELHYVCLQSADFSVQRVAQRVMGGGHDVPEEAIRRRYESSLHNLPEVLAGRGVPDAQMPCEAMSSEMSVIGAFPTPSLRRSCSAASSPSATASPGELGSRMS